MQVPKLSGMGGVLLGYVVAMGPLLPIKLGLCGQLQAHCAGSH